MRTTHPEYPAVSKGLCSVISIFVGRLKSFPESLRFS
jgi:hypothetical protein